MELFHITVRTNVSKIRQNGLRIGLANGKLAAVWLVGRPRLGWAWIHVAKHQGQNVAEMAMLPVCLPEEALQYRGSNVWVSYRDVETKFIGEPVSYDDFMNLVF